MEDGEDDDLSWFDAIVDAVGKPGDGCFTDIAVGDWVAMRMVGDRVEHLLNRVQKFFPETFPSLFVPIDRRMEL